MKKQFYLFIGIVAMLVNANAFGQTPISTYEDFDAKYSEIIVDGTFCFGDNVSLEVEQDESHDRYEWYYVEGNSQTLLPDENTSTYTGSYGPGYHIFRVLAFTDAGCFEEEEIGVYVLPEISVDRMDDEEYCVNDLPPTDGSEGSIELLAEIDQSGFDDEFELFYQWKKNGEAISGATNSTYIVGSIDDETEIGVFEYSVDISFAVNDGGCLKNHSIAQITVTPAPEKPEIQIGTTGHTRGQ
ncbi:hypothetical protein [Litoribacter populi]|uniref:hypothetical protein n=1 Tax=Litoribacter populi TaxID=2598460 RepID=UPI00117D0F27|nr:hypothetical protein [Litoribacter populi]